MVLVATYHGTSYIGQVCASTISIATMCYALMDHCMHSVTLYCLMITACSSYAIYFAMADKLRAIRRHRDMKGSGAMRLIVYIMIISTSIYDNSKIQGEGEARPQGLCHTTQGGRLRTPSRRSVEPIAGGSEFVALTLETVTGGREHSLSRERYDALHGNTARRRLYTHVHVTGNCTYARKPPDVTNLSHSGGLRAIVRGQGRLRAACEEGWGTMCDDIRATKVRTSRWGHDNR